MMTAIRYPCRSVNIRLHVHGTVSPGSRYEWQRSCWNPHSEAPSCAPTGRYKAARAERTVNAPNERGLPCAKKAAYDGERHRAMRVLGVIRVHEVWDCKTLWGVLGTGGIRFYELPTRPQHFT